MVFLANCGIASSRLLIMRMIKSDKSRCRGFWASHPTGGNGERAIFMLRKSVGDKPVTIVSTKDVSFFWQ